MTTTDILKLSVGDRVVFKTESEFINEFGRGTDKKFYTLDIHFGLAPEMSHYFGECATITQVIPTSFYGSEHSIITLDFDSGFVDSYDWTITTDMVKLCNEKADICVPIDDYVCKWDKNEELL